VSTGFERAQIVLHAARGLLNARIAERDGVHVDTPDRQSLRTRLLRLRLRPAALHL
jgi:hypothetical protein